jgi:DNA-binding winged helix-turn-helix (wHTH) protein
VAQPNQIIKRDELTKKVWEDNGVFVGRSLDTYISKLRKKLKDDDSVRLINVHGVGYKLEVDL